MSKNESLKIELDFLKVAFSALLIALFGIISYAFLNFQTMVFAMFLVLCFGLIITTIAIFIILKMSISRLKELRNLKERK